MPVSGPAGVWGPINFSNSQGLELTGTLTVYTDSARTIKATVYTDQTAVTTAPNPVSPDTLGNFTVYATPGLYYGTFTHGGTSTSTLIPVAPVSANITVTANVKDYGAKGDGVTDDTAAIKAAMVAAAAGGTVYFPAGTFIANLADSPAQSTGWLAIRGAGKYATIVKGSTAVDHPLGLFMPGEVSDMTVDGGNATVNGLVVETSGSITISEMAVRRVRCRNAATTWNLIVWDTAQVYNIDKVYLEDVTVESPSPAASDAFAVSYVNVCHVSNMEFRGLARSPNFFNINTLIADGIFSDGCTGTASVVFDAGVKEAVVTNLVVAATGSSNSAVLVNTPKLRATGWSLTNPTWGIGVVSGAGFVASTADWEFHNCELTNGIAFTQPLKRLKIVGGYLSSISNSQVILDQSPGSSTTSEVTIVGASLDATASHNPILKATNAVTWTTLKMSGNIILNSPSPVISGSFTFGANSRLADNAGYNPVGVVSPGVPGSGSPVAAVQYDRYFWITTAAGSTTVAISSGPTITLQASVAGQFVFCPAGQTLTPSYTNPPTWVVEGN